MPVQRLYSVSIIGRTNIDRNEHKINSDNKTHKSDTAFGSSAFPIGDNPPEFLLASEPEELVGELSLVNTLRDG